MHRFTAATLVVAASAFGLAGCSSGTPTGSVEDFCTGYADFSEAAFFEGVDETDVTAVLSALSEMVAEAKQIKPPKEIADDWTTVFQATEDHVQAMKGFDWTTQEGQQEYRDLMADYQSDELDSATAQVESYVSEHCDS